MISEKTVELNVTRELLNYFEHLSGSNHFVIGPTQTQETKRGYDARIKGTHGAFVQYKRAYVKGTVWTWHLNRTKKQDQHERLQKLEAKTDKVYYVFPYFHTVPELTTHGKRLLTRIFCYKPSQINPVGGPTGHHEVTVDTTTMQFYVQSDKPERLPRPMTISELIRDIRLSGSEVDMGELAREFNTIVLGHKRGSKTAGGAGRADDGNVDSLLLGNCIFSTSRTG